MGGRGDHVPRGSVHHAGGTKMRVALPRSLEQGTHLREPSEGGSVRGNAVPRKENHPERDYGEDARNAPSSYPAGKHMPCCASETAMSAFPRAVRQQRARGHLMFF